MEPDLPSLAGLRPNVETKQEQSKPKELMNKIKQLFNSNRPVTTFNTYLAACATVAAAVLVASTFQGRTYASGSTDEPNNTQVAELYELQAAFHAAASHGGNIDAMMELWADDGSLTAGGVLYSGKDAIRTFFATQSGAFKHNWVSLAATPKTQFEINGNTAQLYFECHYADPSVTPYVLRSDISATGTAKKVNGTWVFWNIVAGPAPL